jgi:predicted ATP-dependent serine protease
MIRNPLDQKASKTVNHRQTIILTPSTTTTQGHDLVWPIYHPEFAKLFGGRLVGGGVYLLGGRPGVGKSTAMLQLIHDLLSDHFASQRKQ